MTSPSPARSLRLDIEGLRAVAVLTVLLYHLRVPGLSGGFAGVDVFFVISGFLITSLMLREVERTGTVSLLTFYARRARRLLPAASLVLVFTLAAGWWALPASERTNLLTDVLGSTLYVVNWVLAGRAVDYLAEDAGASPLQHYWSLSVEEQFYVIWPLLILLALLMARRARLKPRRIAFLMLALLLVASLGWSIVLTRTDPATAYFVTTTRLWELAAGALLAFLVGRLARLPRPVAEVLVLAGLALIAYGMLTIDTATPWPGVAAAIPVVGSVLVIAAGVGRQDTLGARLLSLPPMVWVGGLSYAIYLWHWPLIVLAEARWGALPLPALVAVGLGSLVLAWLTKHLVEDPIRFNRGLAASSVRSLLAAGTSMALICSVVLVGWVTRPTLSGTTASPGATALVADQEAAEWAVRSDPENAWTSSGALEPLPELATQDIPGYYDDECQIQPRDSRPRADCVYGRTGSTTEVVLWGDSKLGQHFSGLDFIAEAEGWRLTTYLKSACPPTVAGAKAEDCSEFGRRVVDELLNRERPPHLVLVSTGDIARPGLVEGMLEGIGALTDAGVPVVVLADNSSPGSRGYECAAEHPDDLRTCDFRPGPAAGDEVLTIVANTLDLPVVDLNEWSCSATAETCPVAIGGQLIYRQGSHVTDTYARSLTPFLYRELSELGLTRTATSDISLGEVPVRDVG